MVFKKSSSKSFQNDYLASGQYSRRKRQENELQWERKNSVPGVYRVMVSYPSSRLAAHDANFKVDVDGTVYNHIVDQRKAANDVSFDGVNFKILGDFYVKSTSDIKVMLNNRFGRGKFVTADAVRFEYLRDLKGVKGDKGDKGDMGPQGLQGAKGDKGDTGAQGAQGIQGVAGAKGDKGDQGKMGPQGLQGAKGDKGDTGAQGAQGIQGIQGVAGAKGDKGEDGAGCNVEENAEGAIVTCGDDSVQIRNLSSDPRGSIEFEGIIERSENGFDFRTVSETKTHDKSNSLTFDGRDFRILRDGKVSYNITREIAINDGVYQPGTFCELRIEGGSGNIINRVVTYGPNIKPEFENNRRPGDDYLILVNMNGSIIHNNDNPNNPYDYSIKTSCYYPTGGDPNGNGLGFVPYDPLSLIYGIGTLNLDWQGRIK
jgi:hypothetical protein